MKDGDISRIKKKMGKRGESGFDSLLETVNMIQEFLGCWEYSSKNA